MIALHVLKCTPCQGQLNKKVYFIKKLSYMIVSRRNDTKPLVKISGFVPKMIMYIFNDYKNLDLFVLSMTNVLNSRPTEMVISLKESFSKEFIIIGLPSHLLMLPVSLLFF